MKSIFNFLFGFRNKTNTPESPVINKKSTRKKNIQPTPASNEVWRPIKDFEGYYEVSSLGNVRSVARNIRRSDGAYIKCKSRPISKYFSEKTQKGIVVSLSKNGRGYNIALKKIIAYAFLGVEPTTNYKIVCIDGDANNLVASNLRYLPIKTKKKSKNKRVSSSAKSTAQVKKTTKADPAQLQLPIQPVVKSTRITTYKAPSKKISKTERKMIVELRKVGYSYNQIVKTTGRSLSTIQRILKQNANKLQVNENNQSVQVQQRIL